MSADGIRNTLRTSFLDLLPNNIGRVLKEQILEGQYMVDASEMKKGDDDKFWAGLALGLVAVALIRGFKDKLSSVNFKPVNYEKGDGIPKKGDEAGFNKMVFSSEVWGVILITSVYLFLIKFISVDFSSSLNFIEKGSLIIPLSVLYTVILSFFNKFWFGLSIAMFTITFLLSFWIFTNNAQVIQQETIDNKNQLLVGNINTWIVSLFAIFAVFPAVYYLRKLWGNID